MFLQRRSLPEDCVLAVGDAAWRRHLWACWREMTRAGPPHSDAMLAELQPLIDRAVASLAERMGGRRDPPG